MPSSTVRTFTNPDDYAATIHTARAELTVTGRGNFIAHQTRIELHCLWMQRLDDSLPRILHVDLAPGRAAFTFVERPGPDVFVNGVPAPLGVIVRHSEAHDVYHRSTGAMLLSAMSLPIQDMASVGSSIVGCALTPPHDVLVVTPTPSAITRLWRLHAAAGRLAEEAPEVLASPEAARGLEQELMQALVACLSTTDVQENRSAQRRHDRIMQRFHAVLEENIGSALYVPDLCAAIGVPERTLRTCCLEHLGMSPKEYLSLRRMKMARHDLREADPAATTVTDIAMRYGFWELGRFAVGYRCLFGEAPSATLHRAP